MFLALRLRMRVTEVRVADPCPAAQAAFQMVFQLRPSLRCALHALLV